jgi:hypothetical protein
MAQMPRQENEGVSQDKLGSFLYIQIKKERAREFLYLGGV